MRAPRPTVLRLVDTLRPMLLAPLGSVVVHGAWMVAFRRPPLAASLIVCAIIYGLSLAAGLLLVMPAFAFFPTLRQPSIGVALVWGALVAIVSAAVLYEPSEVRRWEVAAGFAAAGEASGLVYAVAARRNARDNR